MQEGVWQHHQLFDGTYTFEDLIDAHEFLDVKQANADVVREFLKKTQ